METYQQIVTSDSCKLCILGIEDVSLADKLINVLQYKRVSERRGAWQSAVKNIDDAVTFYNSLSVSFMVWTSRQDVPYMSCKVINAFLTEQAYEHKSIKYSNIIANRPHTNYDMFIRRVRYNRRSIRNLYPDANDIDEKEEKYSSIEKVDGDMLRQQMLKRKHIMAADGFMVVYDVRYQDSLDKIRKHLKHIFDIKGYFAMIEKIKNDEMCFFPVSLIGVNLDIITDKTQTITKTQIDRLSMEYYVDNERMPLFEASLPGLGVNSTNAVIRNAIKGLTQIIVDYHYYQSLDEDQIKKLKANSKSNNCLIL